MLFVVLTNPDGSTQLVYIVRPLSFLLDEEGPCAKWHAYGLWRFIEWKVDRKNEYRQLDGMYFPHWENPARPLGSTIVDAELVIDTDPRTKQVCLVRRFRKLTVDVLRVTVFRLHCACSALTAS